MFLKITVLKITILWNCLATHIYLTVKINLTLTREQIYPKIGSESVKIKTAMVNIYLTKHGYASHGYPRWQ